MEPKRHFTDEEHEAIIMAVAEGQNEFSEKDVEKLLEWIIQRNIDKCFADMIIMGELVADVRGKEIVFKKRNKN